MTDEIKQKIYDILIKAGASDDEWDRLAFTSSFPKCREYRFCGYLGFGGKVWYQPYHDCPVEVNCYREDLTSERQEIIDRTNAALAELDFGELPPEQKVWTAQ